MVPSHTMRRLALTPLAALLACQQPPDIVWTGEHVAFGTDGSNLVCGGTLSDLDARAGALIDRFGAGKRTIHYYYIPDDLDPFCAVPAEGCAKGDRIYAKHVPMQHELVHAARASKLPPVFEEGLATFWGDPWPIAATVPREDLESLFETQAIDTQQEYERAAHFVAFLDELGGSLGLLELDRLLDEDSSAAEIDAALLEIYGADLRALLTQYQDYPECRGTVEVSPYCEGEAPMLPQETTELSVELGCDTTDSVGPFYDAMCIDGVVKLGPTVSGTRFIALTGDAAGNGGKVLLRSCMPCAEPGYEEAVLWFENTSTLLLPEEMLPPGRYTIRFMAPVDAGPTTLGLFVG